MGLHSIDNKKVGEIVIASLASVVTAQSYASANSQWYCPYMAINGSLINGSALSENIFRSIPFVITRKVQLLEAALYLVSGGKKPQNQSFVPKFRIGIYDSDPVTLQPRNLLVAFPEITVSAVNAVYSLGSINKELIAGVYYYAIITQAEQALVFRAISSAMQQMVLNFNSMSATTPVTRIEKAMSYPATGLPAIFPASSTYFTTTGFNPEFFAIKSLPLNLFEL